MALRKHCPACERLANVWQHSYEEEDDVAEDRAALSALLSFRLASPQELEEAPPSKVLDVGY